MTMFVNRDPWKNKNNYVFCIDYAYRFSILWKSFLLHLYHKMFLFYLCLVRYLVRLFEMPGPA